MSTSTTVDLVNHSLINQIFGWLTKEKKTKNMSRMSTKNTGKKIYCCEIVNKGNQGKY